MDSVGTLWAVASVLPVVFITALCIFGCRRKSPVHITETGYYVDKPHYHPPSSSFIVMKGPPGNIIFPRTSTSHTIMSTQEMSLTVPRSPIPPDSRRSSVGRDIKAFPSGFDTAPISPGLSPPKNQEVDDEDHEYDDYPNYSNEYKSTPPYIDVLPDVSSIKPVETESPSALINRESMSSVIYMNVEGPPQSNEATDDNNYVNVGDSKESLEYVNVDEAVKPHSSTYHQSDDDDMHDYENLGNDHIG